MAAGRVAEAIAALREAVRGDPRDSDARMELGNALAMAGDAAGAQEQYRAVIAREAGHADANCNLGYLLAHAGRLDAAIGCYRRALAARPDFPEARFNLGHALQRRGLLREAAGEYRRALALRPDLVPAKLNLAGTLQDLGEVDAAVGLYREVLAARPGLAGVHASLGMALLNLDRVDDAAASLDRALALDPGVGTARWLRPRLLPVVYHSEAEIESRRAGFREGLERLARETRLDRPEAVEDAWRGVALRTNFHVNYQARDDLGLQRTYGELVCRIAAARHPRWRQAPPPAADGPLRVGFASAFLWDHTVGKLFRGWIEHLAGHLGAPSGGDGVAIHGYHLGVKRDAATARIEAACAGFVQVEDDTFYTDERQFAAVCERIRADRLHVLVFPEIGMDEGTLRVAAHRLAAVQCAAWGHPVTTGMPTVDHFLSSEWMEPRDGERHYSEGLVRLPGLSIHYPRPAWPREPRSRASLGLPADGVLYLSCQSIYKYHPAFDGLFPAIAREVPAARFVFLSHPVAALTAKLGARLARAFAAAGLDADRHCLFLPRLSQADYHALNAAADVFLDTPGWSGGNTTLEAVAHGLPVVTLPGPLMRQRHALAVLRALGLADSAAADRDGYVAAAARLGRDAGWRDEMRARVLAGTEGVFEQSAGVAGLARFLREAAGR